MINLIASQQTLIMMIVATLMEFPKDHWILCNQLLKEFHHGTIDQRDGLHTRSAARCHMISSAILKLYYLLGRYRKFVNQRTSNKNVLFFLQSAVAPLMALHSKTLGHRQAPWWLKIGPAFVRYDTYKAKCYWLSLYTLFWSYEYSNGVWRLHNKVYMQDEILEW